MLEPLLKISSDVKIPKLSTTFCLRSLSLHLELHHVVIFGFRAMFVTMVDNAALDVILKISSMDVGLNKMSFQCCLMLAIGTCKHPFQSDQ